MDYKNRDCLDQKYSIEKLNIYQIAKLCNCSSTNIWYWLKKFNISIRSNGEAHHLSNGNHCNLSNEARQWIDGELLGDGCLEATSKYSASFRYSSKYKEYIDYVSDILESFGIKRIEKIYKRYHKKTGNYDYNYRSLSYEELLPIYKCWYPEGKKIIPQDLKLTPLALRQEHIGDGHLAYSQAGRAYIVLATCGFLIKDVEWLTRQLNKVGFKSTRQPSTNKICISGYSTKQFLDYIGKSPVKCYKYKFAY